MASGYENLEDSHMGKSVQTKDQKEELSMEDEEKVIEREKVKVGGENGEGKIGDEREMDIKNVEAKKEDVKTMNEVKNDEAMEDVKEIKEMKNDEAMKGDAKDTNDIKNDQGGKENEMKNDETKKEDEGKRDEIDISVDEKEDESVKDGLKKEDEENEAKEVKQNKVSEGTLKERVVTIDQNPKFVDENGDESNKINDEKKKKKNDVEGDDVSIVDVSNLSFNEESDLFANLKENEKKALMELKTKVEEAINGNQLFKKKEGKEKSSENNGEKEMAKPKENEVKEDAKVECGEANASMEEPAKKNDEQESEEKRLKSINVGIEEKIQVMQEGMESDEINKDIKLWGVPLLPSKGGNATDVVLLKFLRARDFKVVDSFEMLRNTLQWRKENSMDSILDEDFGNDFQSTAFINGTDRQGHPVCYNVFGVLSDEEMYQKTLGTEENRERFLRWRLRLMEKGIEKLDFNGVSSLMQISDLKNTPGPSKKEVRHVLKQVAGLLQDNYPEFVVKHVFINVPFWYYAFAALLSTFLTQRTKSKFVYARPSKVIETLLKYIDAEEIPVSYGGLKRDNDSDFSPVDHAEEVFVKANSIETIEIPIPEAGSVVIWDLVVLGWEISYREEFIPDNEKSYGIIVQKQRKMAVQEGSVRNSFKNSEPGKIILIIDNAAFKTKKRAFYRYKIKNNSS